MSDFWWENYSPMPAIFDTDVDQVMALRDGDPIGWMPRADTRCAGIPVLSLEPIRPWVDSPYVVTVAEILHDLGALTGDVNQVRRVLLQTWRLQQIKRAREESEQRFMTDLLIARPESYLKAKEAERMREADKDFEDLPPGDPEDFASFLDSLPPSSWEEPVSSDDEPPGALSSALTEEEWRSLG